MVGGKWCSGASAVAGGLRGPDSRSCSGVFGISTREDASAERAGAVSVVGVTSDVDAGVSLMGLLVFPKFFSRPMSPPPPGVLGVCGSVFELELADVEPGQPKKSSGDPGGNIPPMPPPKLIPIVPIPSPLCKDGCLTRGVEK